MESNELEARVRLLERKVIYLAFFCGVLLMFLALMVADSSTKRVQAAEAPKVLHLRGLVIEDAQGRARILLGAPFPSVPDRLRQDATTVAMLFLDEKGHDRFSIGELMPAQINGKVSPHFHRIALGYGLTIHDSSGNERGGMGFLSNGGTVNRAVIALDRPGGDAWGAVVDDKTGFAGMNVSYPPEVGADGVVIGTQGKKAFVSLKDLNDVPRATLGIDSNQMPSLQLFDKTGKLDRDLLNEKSGRLSAKQ